MISFILIPALITINITFFCCNILILFVLVTGNGYILLLVAQKGQRVLQYITLLVGVCLAQPSDAFVPFAFLQYSEHYCVRHLTPIASTDENHYIFHFSKTSWWKIKRHVCQLVRDLALTHGMKAYLQMSVTSKVSMLDVQPTSSWIILSSC